MEVAEHYGILIAFSKDDGGAELRNDRKQWELRSDGVLTNYVFHK